MDQIMIRMMNAADWPEVARIYEEGLLTGNATFQQRVPSWQDWDYEHLKQCRLICLADDRLVGWTALSPVSGRCVYSGVAEVSIYIGEQFRGKGIGFQLLQKLIVWSEKEKIWTLQSGIFPENIGSLKIHEKLGFRRVGFRERIGKLNGEWRDVLLMERRSREL